MHPANIMDRDGVKLLLADPVPTQFPRLWHVWLDAGYKGTQLLPFLYSSCAASPPCVPDMNS
jgi:hypothetical protein